MIMKIKFLIVGLAMGIFLNSCTKDMLHNDIDSSSLSGDKKEQLSKRQETEKHLEKFAGILSKVTYANKEVREFLKQESIKQFDKNYDVLYYLIKNEKIEGKTFKDILISYSSASEIEEIENAVPLLNILVPEIAFFDVSAENLDVEDNEIPVAVSGEKTTSLYLNGKEEVKLEKGEIPNFHVFVVNINSRVIIPSNKNAGSNTVVFKSPNFDGTIKNNTPLKSTSWVDASIVGQKAIDAYKYFYKDDGSINQKAFQRDYIYYGITPTKQQGQLNRSVTEYISFIEINPNVYFEISDHKITDSFTNDPRINSKDGKILTTSQEKRSLSEAELIDRLWTKGSYNFRFEIIKSNAAQPQIVYVPLKPNEIWNFNIDYSYRHSTWFRRSKNTYTINANKFTSKRVFLNKMVSLGKWNIADEALSKYVKIYEEDENADETLTETYEMSNAIKINFDGEGSKSGIGLKAGVETNSTEKVTKSITIKRKLDSDPLGFIEIYFYDPLVENVNHSTGTCNIHTYNTGKVEFGISVK